jgi:hypothetical protein
MSLGTMPSGAYSKTFYETVYIGLFARPSNQIAAYDMAKIL